MRPPLPREPSRVTPSHRRPAAHRRAAAQNRSFAPPSGPAACRSTSGHLGSVAAGPSATRSWEIGRPRIGRRGPWHLAGELRQGFVGAAASGSGAVAPPWDCVPCAGPSAAALRLPSSSSPRQAAAVASFEHRASRPRSLLPPPPAAPSRASVHQHSAPLRPPSAPQWLRPHLPIRHPSGNPTAPSARPLWPSPPPPSSYSRPCSSHWHGAFNPPSIQPPRLPLPLAAPRASPAFCAPTPLPVRPPPASQLRTGRNMSGGGDDLFGPYSQPDQQFSSGYYPPLPPPFSPPRLDNTGSQGPGHGLPGFDLNNPYRTSSAASAHGGMAGLSGYAGYGGPMSAATPHGGMAGPSHGYGGTMSAATSHGGMFGPSHGYSGYGGPSGYFQMPFHAGGQHMSQPARHSTSSLSGFEGGPYASDLANQLPPMLPSYGPYGEGSSHGGCVHMSYASPSWHLATMRNEEMSSAAPRRRRGPRTQVLQQPGFLDAEVASNDHSMPAVDESSSGDNAAIVGNAAVVEDEEGSGGSMGGQGEGSSSDGDLDWSSDDDSSDEHYEELYKALDDAYGDEEDWSSDDDSSDGLYEEFYKVLDDVYGDEEPVIVQAIKELSENSRRELKQLKKVVVRAMYEESMNRHVREIKETRAEFVERTLRSLRQC